MMSKILFKNLSLVLILIAIIFPKWSHAENNSNFTSNATMKFFNGDISAKVSWTAPFSTTKKNQIKIELNSKDGQAYDLDPVDFNVDLFMAMMPDMGTEKQNVVNINDTGGTPIPGVFAITDLKFSMSGSWTLFFSIPNPKNSNLVETQKLEVTVQ